MAQRVTLAIPDPSNPSVDINVGTALNPFVTSGGGGSVAAPSIAGGEYNSTPPTLTNGQTDAVQLDSRGNLRSTLISPDSGTPVSVTGAGIDGSSNTLNALRVASYGWEFNGSAWDRGRKPNQTSRIVSAAASTNATVAKASAGDLFRVTGFNANAAARYLKIYNKATAPTVGTDTPVWTEYLPAQARFELSFPKGYYLSAGISYALTTGGADSDTGVLTAGDVLSLNLAYA